MLLDKMQRSVLVEKKGYFSSNQINFVRYIDMACGAGFSRYRKRKNNGIIGRCIKNRYS